MVWLVVFVPRVDCCCCWSSADLEPVAHVHRAAAHGKPPLLSCHGPGEWNQPFNVRDGSVFQTRAIQRAAGHNSRHRLHRPRCVWHADGCGNHHWDRLLLQKGAWLVAVALLPSSLPSLPSLPRTPCQRERKFWTRATRNTRTSRHDLVCPGMCIDVHSLSKSPLLLPTPLVAPFTPLITPSSLMKTRTPLPHLFPHPYRSSARTKRHWRWSGCFRRIRRKRWRTSTNRSETRPGVPT
jgi:hypothetical protein